MSGNGWGVELWHEASCPENVENHPDPVRPVHEWPDEQEQDQG